MLNKSAAYQPNIAVAKTTSDTPYDHRKAIAYECARETIGGMIAICSYLIDTEEKKPHPDQKRIDELTEKQFRFARERRNLRSNDEEKIKSVTMTYGKKIKAYYADGKAPV